MPGYLSCICRKSISYKCRKLHFRHAVSLFLEGGGVCGTGSCPTQGNARLLAAVTFMGVAVQVTPVMQGSG